MLHGVECRWTIARRTAGSVTSVLSGPASSASASGARTCHMLASHSASVQSRIAASSRSRALSKLRPRLSTQIEVMGATVPLGLIVLFREPDCCGHDLQETLKGKRQTTATIPIDSALVETAAGPSGAG